MQTTYSKQSFLVRAPSGELITRSVPPINPKELVIVAQLLDVTTEQALITYEIPESSVVIASVKAGAWHSATEYGGYCVDAVYELGANDNFCDYSIGTPSLDYSSDSFNFTLTGSGKNLVLNVESGTSAQFDAVLTLCIFPNE